MKKKIKAKKKKESYVKISHGDREAPGRLIREELPRWTLGNWKQAGLCRGSWAWGAFLFGLSDLPKSKFGQLLIWEGIRSREEQ